MNVNKKGLLFVEQPSSNLRKFPIRRRDGENYLTRYSKTYCLLAIRAPEYQHLNMKTTT